MGEAKLGNYIDKKCPFTGKCSIRGRILTGIITKLKMKNTDVIRRDYLHYVKKYNSSRRGTRMCLSTFLPASVTSPWATSHRRRVPTPQQDGQVQHSQGHWCIQGQEVLRQVLICCLRKPINLQIKELNKNENITNFGF